MERKNELLLSFEEPSPPLEIHAAESWRGVSVQYSRLKLPAQYEFHWDGNCHYLAYHDLILRDGEMEILGEKPVAGRDLRDLMTYVPAGQTINGWAKPADRLNAFTVVCFNTEEMAEELQQELVCSEPRPHVYFEDGDLGFTMRKLARLMADQTKPASKVYAETLSLAAALEMFRLTTEQSMPKAASGPGTLSRAQSELVRGFIGENLARDIGLDELAQVCCLTRFHFSRAFKATFAEPPYQYILRRRIERAQQMLASTQVPIADVAMACGFNGATQFARSFRGMTGKTPLEFRRSA